MQRHGQFDHKKIATFEKVLSHFFLPTRDQGHNITGGRLVSLALPRFVMDTCVYPVVLRVSRVRLTCD